MHSSRTSSVLMYLRRTCFQGFGKTAGLAGLTGPGRGQYQGEGKKKRDDADCES